MQLAFNYCFRFIRKIFTVFSLILHKILTTALFYVYRVEYSTFITQGIPFVMVAARGRLKIGSNFKMNNIIYSNPIGRIQRCSFFVGNDASIIIGENVQISFTAIACKMKIIIEDNVMIGGGTCIYDTDFHQLDYRDRLEGIGDIKASPVLIKKNCFIGANSTILKGVTIGENSVIGACSVISKDVPPNEIWAGNPARLIRSI